MDERQREVETAPHAARIGSDAPVGGVGEADPVKQHVGACVPFGARDRMEGRLKAQQFTPGHERVDGRVLEGDAD